MKIYRRRRGLLLLLLLLLAACTPPPAPPPLEELGIISRHEWDAAPPNHTAHGEHGLFDPEQNPTGWMEYPEPLAEMLATVVVHHSALPLSDGPREIQRKHVGIGFADIGYHFVIDAEGRIYEGRRLRARGAHTGGYNTGSVGIVLLGNFEIDEPTAAQMTALAALAGSLAEQFNLTHLAGHRDFQPEVTDCPGDLLEARLPTLAQKLGLEFGTAGYAGPQVIERWIAYHGEE